MSLPRSQCGEINWNHVKTIEQVFTEFSRDDLILQIDIRRCDDSNIRWNRLRIPDTFEFMFLQGQTVSPAADNLRC